MSETIIRGDTVSWRIPILNSNGTALALQGCTVVVTSKRHPDDVTPFFRHHITISAGGVVTTSSGMALASGGASAGIVVETITALESAAFTPGTYSYDLEVRLADGRVYTPILGETFTVVADYTTS
jgi:hypothetical protein